MTFFRIAIPVVIMILLITLAVGLWLSVKEDIRRLEELYKNINNLLCDYEDELVDLSEVLGRYHELMDDYQIPMIATPDFYQWMQAGKPTVENDDW